MRYYTGTRTTFALSIIPAGITMTMTAITIAPRSEETRVGDGGGGGGERESAILATWGESAHVHASRSLGRQLGKLLTNNTAGANDTWRSRGEEQRKGTVPLCLSFSDLAPRLPPVTKSFVLFTHYHP